MCVEVIVCYIIVVFLRHGVVDLAQWPAVYETVVIAVAAAAAGV